LSIAPSRLSPDGYCVTQLFAHVESVHPDMHWSSEEQLASVWQALNAPAHVLPSEQFAQVLQSPELSQVPPPLDDEEDAENDPVEDENDPDVDDEDEDAVLGAPPVDEPAAGEPPAPVPPPQPSVLHAGPPTMLNRSSGDASACAQPTLARADARNTSAKGRCMELSEDRGGPIEEARDATTRVAKTPTRRTWLPPTRRRARPRIASVHGRRDGVAASK
jgi:hypothetical protein